MDRTKVRSKGVLYPDASGRVLLQDFFSGVRDKKKARSIGNGPE